MKKILLATSLTLAAPLACADFLAVYGGIGQWKSDYSGDLGDSSATSASIEGLGFSDTTNGFYYVGFEHFVPLLPNIRLQHTELSDSNTTILGSTFTIDGTTFLPGDEVIVSLDLTHTDAVLYYELLDNWVSLDLGVALRKFNGHAQVEGLALQERVRINETIPLIYVGAQVDVPMTGIYAGVDAYLISAGDNKISDYSVKVGYVFDFVAVDFGLELGYRDLSLEYDEDTTADLSFKGAYLGATLRF